MAESVIDFRLALATQEQLMTQIRTNNFVLRWVFVQFRDVRTRAKVQSRVSLVGVAEETDGRSTRWS